jgi:hypothetical protein
VQKELRIVLKGVQKDIGCIHCGKYRYVKVVNEDGASVITKVAVKRLRYILITTSLKQLYLFK